MDIVTLSTTEIIAFEGNVVSKIPLRACIKCRLWWISGKRLINFHEYSVWGEPVNLRLGISYGGFAYSGVEIMIGHRT